MKKITSLIYWITHFIFFDRLGLWSHFHTPLRITPKYIRCGRSVKVWKHGRIEGCAKYNNICFEPLITLRDYVSIQQNVHITCAESIIIGSNTAIAANVTITDIHHPYNDINIPIERNDIIVKPVIIGENCKLYNNAVILPGTIIGKHCTIGANSVVGGSFPDYCVIVGAPARIVKYYNIETQQWEETINR